MEFGSGNSRFQITRATGGAQFIQCLETRDAIFIIIYTGKNIMFSGIFYLLKKLVLLHKNQLKMFLICLSGKVEFHRFCLY